MIKRTHKDPTPLVDDIFAALKAQTVTVPGSDAAELVIPQLAANIKASKSNETPLLNRLKKYSLISLCVRTWIEDAQSRLS